MRACEKGMNGCEGSVLDGWHSCSVRNSWPERNGGGGGGTKKALADLSGGNAGYSKYSIIIKHTLCVRVFQGKPMLSELLLLPTGYPIRPETSRLAYLRLGLAGDDEVAIASSGTPADLEPGSCRVFRGFVPRSRASSSKLRYLR